MFVPYPSGRAAGAGGSADVPDPPGCPEASHRLADGTSSTQG
jgi:hypothetical protein